MAKQKVHEFHVRKKAELNTMKFTILHEVNMEYFMAQKEVLIENFEEFMVEAKQKKYGQEMTKLIHRKHPKITVQERLTYRPTSSMIKKAQKIAEEWYQEECAALSRTFNEFLTVNQRMQQSMSDLVEHKQMDAVVEDIYNYIDKLIIAKK